MLQEDNMRRLFLVLTLLGLATLASQSTAEEKIRQIKVSESVQENNLLHRPDPVYPETAYQHHISGVVVFEILVGVDGRVKKLRLISGHPLLIEAATKAVKQSIYRRTLFNGKPVEVLSSVHIEFQWHSPPKTTSLV
jgi:outer membrane biosynthesis protein TonB